MIHRVKGFSIVKEAEADVFLESPCFLYDATKVGNLISGSCAFSKSSLYIWKFSVHILLKPSLKNFEHNLASMWNEQNSVVVWTSFGIVLFWDWNKNWPFSVLWPLLSFPLPKAHLTSHSRMPGSRRVTTPLLLSRSFRPFLYSSAVYSCHLFLICSASVRSLLFIIKHILIEYLLYARTICRYQRQITCPLEV